MIYFVIYFLNLLDCLFTLNAVNRYGIGIEGNGIMRFLLEKNCFVPFKVFGIAILLYLASRLMTRRLKWMLYFAAVIYSVLLVYHIYFSLF